MAFGRHQVFADRADAGRRLAEELVGAVEGPAVVLGLPRGGVPVAVQVAARLGLPLDVILVRKLGVPGHPELAAGAIGEGGIRVLDRRVLDLSGLTPEDLVDVEAAERRELERRATLYRGDRPPVEVRGATALVVDDGVATGSTARAACRVVASRGAARVHLAVPVSLVEPGPAFDDVTDAVTAPLVAPGLGAVSRAYRDFSQTRDEEVIELLGRGSR